MSVNQRGVYLCMKNDIEAMLTCGGGSTVNCSSVAGLIGVRRNLMHSASKFAL